MTLGELKNGEKYKKTRKPCYFFTSGAKWIVFVFTDPDTPFHFIEGNILKLNPKAEEVMTFYAKMLDHDYTTKKDFNKEFLRRLAEGSFRALLLPVPRWEVVHVGIGRIFPGEGQ